MQRWSINALGVLAVLLANIALAGEPEPVVDWNFDDLVPPQTAFHGDVKRDVPGPRPPEFPDFSPENTALSFGGNGARIVLADPGADSRFDFTAGEEITLESWIRVRTIASGQHRYVVGKGRTGEDGFAPDNQNWALRVHETGGQIRVNFLFASDPSAGGGHWHRWTSVAGFLPKTGWHHIAVAYRFGEPESIQGWIDGCPTKGTWDMAGPTDKAPVVDDAAVWVGSSMGGSAGSSFEGEIDELAIHRTILDEKVLQARFHRKGGPRVVGPAEPEMPSLDPPAGRVLVTFAEGMPARDRWLFEGETWPAETMRWTGDFFLLPRMPLRYDDWGIRAAWDAPVLVRIAADVALPPGEHRFLLRNRALGRLWIDGRLVAKTGPVTENPPDGEKPVSPVASPPKPGVRVVDYHQQEVFGTATIADDGTCRLVLEMIVGGKGRRTETGEVCVAVETPDGHSFRVLRPAGSAQDPLPLTDPAIEAEIARIEGSLSVLDDHNRRLAAKRHDPYWNKRHKAARAWAQAHPAPAVPADGQSHPIDAFLAAKIERAVAQADETDSRQAAHFHEEVLPILRKNCFRCHGEKEKGGLRLNAREAALAGGDSGLPAITPGDADASEMLTRIQTDDPFTRMPPTGGRLPEDKIAILEDWIASGAEWPAPPVTDRQVEQPPVIGDAAFVRRAFLDVIGIPAKPGEIREFLADKSPGKRARLIDELLDRDRYADRQMGYWQDMLAENPTLLNMSLNSTGPFRWFLYDAFRDNKPLDRLVTELIMLRGDPYAGGSAGFALAGENDAPFAAKGHIVASAFMGIELECARCHDSPYHTTTQRDLYSLAAMFSRKTVTVPATSRVPVAFFEKKGRESLIQVTLKPDEPIAPEWPFAETTGVSPDDVLRVMRNPDDSREQLAALITSPKNSRFARVMVNRVWARLMGAGLVEPIADWEGHAPSHPKLLEWLAHELIAHDYDLQHIMRLIMTSRAYQREAIGQNREASPELRFFNAPERRRLTAEQIVDSLHAATDKPFAVDELTFVHDGLRPMSSRLTLGRPRAAWMFASLNNERDRPSLSLPKARAVVDVLKAFGWRGSRQQPVTRRETAANVLQPGILANGTLTQNLTRASYNSALAEIALAADSPERLVETMFLRVLGRLPNARERETFVPAIAEGFDERLRPPEAVEPPETPSPLPQVDWFNHLRSKANTIQRQVEERVKRGPPPDPRLRPEWRKTYEDFIWSLVNTREFVWVP